MRDPSPPRRIRTRRLLLRALGPADAPLLKRALDASLEHLRPWMDWAVEEAADLAAVETRLALFHDRFHAGEEWSYGIFPPAETEILGAVGIRPGEAPGVLEIGYWLRPDVTGRGYATEAAAAATRVGLEQLGARWMEIRCDPANVRSAAVARRLGYRHTRTLPSNATTPDGRPRDTMVWEITAAEFTAR
ncbi:MAG: GNAT family N-acetyltransferase [Gemmatimonadetes bacterium]|nr:GNAT family N-acetyltransferase [Gemmatimonadota bacterium]